MNKTKKISHEKRRTKSDPRHGKTNSMAEPRRTRSQGFGRHLSGRHH